MKRAAMGAGLLALAACNADRAPAPPPTPSSTPSAATAPPVAAEATPGPVATPPTLQPPLTPPRQPGAPIPPASPAPSPPPLTAAEKGETGARAVLLEWARALELGDYDRAFAQWGQQAEARSNMTRAEHAAYWRKFKTITVAMPTGTMEGAAGSLYYEAPTTVVGKLRATGKPYRLAGTVTLRRVNDVDGATPDQLRWHIEQVDLKPVG